MGTLLKGKKHQVAAVFAQLCVQQGLPADAWTYLLLAEFSRVGRA